MKYILTIERPIEADTAAEAAKLYRVYDTQPFGVITHIRKA